MTPLDVDAIIAHSDRDQAVPTWLTSGAVGHIQVGRPSGGLHPVDDAADSQAVAVFGEKHVAGVEVPVREAYAWRPGSDHRNLLRSDPRPCSRSRGQRTDGLCRPTVDHGGRRRPVPVGSVRWRRAPPWRVIGSGPPRVSGRGGEGTAPRWFGEGDGVDGCARDGKVRFSFGAAPRPRTPRV